MNPKAGKNAVGTFFLELLWEALTCVNNESFFCQCLVTFWVSPSIFLCRDLRSFNTLWSSLLVCDTSVCGMSPQALVRSSGVVLWCTGIFASSCFCHLCLILVKHKLFLSYKEIISATCVARNILLREELWNKESVSLRGNVWNSWCVCELGQVLKQWFIF